MSVGGKRNDLPASDLLALHALVFPLSFPFGRLPRRLRGLWLAILSSLMCPETDRNIRIGKQGYVFFNQRVNSCFDNGKSLIF